MTDPDPDALAEYRSKRQFDQTPEPRGDGAPAHAAPAHAAPARAAPVLAEPEGASEPLAPDVATSPRRVFVVQKHDASRLHYDFRLESEGVLKSWAVPKGPSLDPADKRLAVMVEDHPLEYATFEGSIPQGEYGGGTVLLWDSGWWEQDVAWMKETKGASKGAEKQSSLHSPEEGLAKGELKFVLHGRKLSGSWALVKTRWQGENNWLLIKHRDDAARPGSKIVEEAPDSVITGRTLEEIAAAGSGAPGGAGGVTGGSSAGAAPQTEPEEQTEPDRPPRGREAG